MKNKLTLAQKIDSLKQSIELTDSEKKTIYDMKMKKLSKVFQQYCKLGDFEMVKYLLTSPDLEINYNLSYDNVGFKELCRYNHFDIIKYVLTSSELKQHAYIQDGGNVAIDIACSYDHKNLVKYFLTAPDLKIHSNIYDFNSRAIESAFNSTKKTVVDYLITEYDLDINKIDNEVKKRLPDLEKRISLAKLNEKLNETLPQNNTAARKIKI